MNQTEKTKTSTIVNSVIGVAIMLIFPFLPIHLPEVTDVGMQVLGIFLGTLYLWATVDAMWSSLLSIVALGLSSYASMSDVLVSMLGNSMLMQMLFIMILSGALVKFKITDYIANFCITRKVTRGRPWMLVYVIGLGCLLMSGFVDSFAPIFLFWPILTSIFSQIGMTKKDKAARIMMILIVVATLLGMVLPSFRSNGMILIGNFISVSESAMGQAYYVNGMAYMITGLLVCIATWTVVVLFCKFILRPDCEKLKDYDSSRGMDLPKMTGQQKAMGISFIILIAFMLVPSLVNAETGVFAYLAENLSGLPLLCVAVLAAIPIKNKPLLNVQEVISTNFSWSCYFICAAAILLGSALTADSTGITEFLAAVFVPLFGGMGYAPFIMVIILVAGVLSNFCNSLVVCMIFQGIIASVCAANGYNPIPIITIVTFSTHSVALFTPAASPFASVLHSNKEWFTTADRFKYTGIFVVVELVCFCLIGVPVSIGIAGLF